MKTESRFCIAMYIVGIICLLVVTIVEIDNFYSKKENVSVDNKLKNNDKIYMMKFEVDLKHNIGDVVVNTKDNRKYKIIETIYSFTIKNDKSKEGDLSYLAIDIENGNLERLWSNKIK